MHLILVIYVGSTSTKVGLFSDENVLIKETIDHTANDLSQLYGYDEWLQFHQAAVERILKGHREETEGIHLVVSRGGLTKSVEGGAYLINDTMLGDLRSGKYGWHPCNVGPAIAHEIAKRFDVRAIIYDSPVADEMVPVVRVSGLKGIERRAAFHVLSQKSEARKAAEKLGIRYVQGNFIVAHLGGGITICAHNNGKIVDGSHGLSEGPFTPQRTGALPLQEVLELCFSGQFTKEELSRKFFSQGGAKSYLGTHDMAAAEQRAADGDEDAKIVLRAMGYQISKTICSMAAVLNGCIDAIILTGKLCLAKTVTREIRRRVSFLGKLFIFPEEDELESLARGGLAVLRNKETPKVYI